jgi:hypothetical protein
VLLWILNELKCWRQCMLFGFIVSKTWIETNMSWLEQILVQTLQKKLSHISRHLKSQFQHLKATASVLHVCCIINVWVLQDVTMQHKFKLYQNTHPRFCCIWVLWLHTIPYWLMAVYWWLAYSIKLAVTHTVKSNSNLSTVWYGGLNSHRRLYST